LSEGSSATVAADTGKANQLDQRLGDTAIRRIVHQHIHGAAAAHMARRAARESAERGEDRPWSRGRLSPHCSTACTIAVRGLVVSLLVLLPQQDSAAADTFTVAAANLGTVTLAAYSPVETVTGDPYLHFRSAFRAETHLIVRRFHGALVRDRDLGWLAAGRHTAEFSCRGRSGSFYVHVNGTARDGARQLSPVRRIRCR
jgi:hypothetical protein